MHRLLLAAALLLLLPAVASAQPLFVDEAASRGLDFTYQNGAGPDLYYPEIFGAGAALFDYDGDGDLDVYLLQGGPLDAEPAARPTDRLFRQDRDGSFVDVTASSGGGAVSGGYGMGAATGDIDGDGDPDLYITRFGPNQLLRNQGDGTFVDVTASAGVDDPRWSVPAVFFDADADGDLDLYVGNYVDFSFAVHRECFAESGARDYCKPQVYRALPDRLFLNRGDGTFDDAGARAGLADAAGPALGAVAEDFDGDGRLDLYVANDGTENFQWMAQGGGAFVDDALLAGTALSGEGKPEGSMGVDARDVDGDGDVDLFMTHLVRETHTLYLNEGDGLFHDATLELGLSTATFPYTGFGAAWIDVQNDGRLDLLIVNGAVQAIESRVRARDPFPYGEPNQLLVQGADGRYVETAAGEDLARAEVSRGAAFGDVDGDGAVDVLVTNNDGPPRLLMNRTRERGHWFGVRVLGASGGDALGARIALGGPETVAWHRIRTEGSYLSANDPRRFLGLGARRTPGDLLVEWPDGARRRIVGLPTDVLVTVGK